MKRIQFKAMDLRELIERNFKKKDSMYSDNGMTMAELNRKQAENELKKTQFGRNIQNISQTAGGGYQNTMGGVRPVNAPKVMKAGGMYGKQQEGHKGSPPSITHNNIVHGSMQWENSLEAGRAVSPPPPVTPKQQSEKLMKKLMDSLINEGQGEGNEVESLRDYVLICKGSIPVDAAETSPPATGTMTISPSIHRNTRSVCGETVGHSNVVAPRDDITKFIAEYLSQFLSSSTQEVPERSLFGLFFKSLLQGNVINRSQLNLVFTQFANEYAENRKKSYIVNLLDAIENGWPTLGPDLFNIVLNELVERRLSYKTVLRFIKMAESRFDDENFYTIKIPLTDEFNATCANDPLYVFPLRRFRTIPFIIRYGLMSQNSDDLEIKEFDDEESGEDSAKEDGIENEIDIIDKCYYDNVELRQFYHLVSETEVIGVEGKVEDGNRLEVISHYIPLETGRSNTHNSKAMNREKEIVKKFISIPFEKIRNIDYLRVMCSIFTFSRFDRDVMASLMKSMLLLIKAKKTLLVPLVLDTYATWRDLHRIPKQAIGEFIYIIFSEKLLSQCTFENIITEIKRECPEDAHAIRICMKKHETK